MFEALKDPSLLVGSKNVPKLGGFFAYFSVFLLRFQNYNLVWFGDEEWIAKSPSGP